MGRTPGSKNKKQKRRSEKLLIAKTMPPLYHTLPGEKFDNDKSQVYAWIKSQPDLMNWFLRQLASAGYIVYDSDTGLWTGVDCESEQMPSLDKTREWDYGREQEWEW